MPDASREERGAGLRGARLAGARQALDDTRQLVDLLQAQQRLLASTAPAVELVAGEPLLRSASRIGLLSGSFNPLTTAHAALGAAAMRAGGLDALVWCCAVVTLEKETVARALLVDRLVQLRCYAAQTPGAIVALVNRGLYVDQAVLMRGLVAEGAEIAVVVGFDKAVQLFDPRYYTDRDAALAHLFASARLLVAPRDGDRVEDLNRLLSRPENVPFAGRVRYCDVPDAFRSASSTEARALAAGHRDRVTVARLRRLLPPEGVALATTDDPYAQALAEEDDAYLWRSRWLSSLARQAAALSPPWPSLRALVAASLRRDAVGAEVRRHVRQSQASAEPAALRHALALAVRSGAAGASGAAG